MSLFKKPHPSLERGQALIEYMVLIPIGIMVSFVAAGIIGGLNNAYQQTLNGLTCGGIVQVSEDRPDSTYITLYNHSIELVAQAYNASNNTTTITYRVSSGSQPSISHWTLGVPAAVAARVISTSEQAAYTSNDPTTGAAGLKFDTGYEGTGGGNGGNGGNGGGRRNRLMIDIPDKFVGEDTPVEVRLITITLRGEFEFDEVSATTKAGNSQVATGYISAPVALVDNTNNNSSAPTCGAS